ncbi:MAG: tetratricopeptide repeat protein [Acidobacteria bacterium]|nr:tetratricopeptide repeat protein [Acidobacteriota bacterium]
MLADEPQNVTALEKLADIYGTMGRQELVETAERLLKINPENAAGLYHLATIRFYQGLHDEAIRMVLRVLEKNPADTRSRNLLAIAYGQTFQPGKAEAEFKKAIASAPDDFVTLNNYALFLSERGRTEEAIDRFTEAIDIQPENVQAYVGIGEAYRQSGRMANAQEWYRKALQLDPNQPVAKLYVK